MKYIYTIQLIPQVSPFYPLLFRYPYLYPMFGTFIVTNYSYSYFTLITLFVRIPYILYILLYGAYMTGYGYHILGFLI